MKYTISTHNGSKVARQHNLRNPKVVSKEEHIDIKRIHETWLGEKPETPYARIFGEAVKIYNAEQKEKGHSERQIHDYYHKIKQDKQKRAVYEMVIIVGSFDNHPTESVSKQILKEFVDDWKNRNPNLELIGAYYHEDESTPHCHLDYIPVGKNLKRGMSCQNALVKALNQMGYETINSKDTAQMRWEHAENIALEKICIKHGLEIIHPDKERQAHLSMQELQHKRKVRELETQIKDLQEQNSKLVDRINSLIDYHNELNQTIDEMELGASELAHDIVDNEITLDRYDLIR